MADDDTTPIETPSDAPEPPARRRLDRHSVLVTVAAIAVGVALFGAGFAVGDRSDDRHEQRRLERFDRAIERGGPGGGMGMRGPGGGGMRESRGFGARGGGMPHGGIDVLGTVASIDGDELVVDPVRDGDDVTVTLTDETKFRAPGDRDFERGDLEKGATVAVRGEDTESEDEDAPVEASAVIVLDAGDE